MDSFPKILITGGAGFIGSHLGRVLAERGHSVFLVDLHEPDSEMQWLTNSVRDRIHMIPGSVLDLSFLLNFIKKEKISKIIHTATINDLDILINQPLVAQRVMIEGHMNVLEAGRRSECKRIIFTSSIAVYAPVQYEPIDELHPVHLPNEGPSLASYSSFKLAAESIGLFYWAYHKVDFVALRLSAVYGFGMRYPMYVKPMVENSLHNRETIFPAGGDMRRDYTYIEDIVQGIILALDYPGVAPSRIYNLCSGGPLRSAREVANIVHTLLPEANIEIGPGLSEIETHDLRNRGRLSTLRIQRELNFSSRFILEDGIKSYIRQYKLFLSR